MRTLLIIWLGVMIPETGFADVWTIDVIDNGKVFSHMSDRSLCIDSEDQIRIAYGADNLYYARFDGNSWNLEVADPCFGVGRYASMELDACGNPHIAYFQDFPISDLKYAFLDESGWHTETVDDDDIVGLCASLVLDDTGYPHICYYDDTNFTLKYAERDDVEWWIETISIVGDVSFWDITRIVSSAMDDDGILHVAYHRVDTGDLMYAIRDETNWYVEIVDSTGFVGEFPSLVVDSEGFPHISYDDETNDFLKYAEYDGTTWQIQIVDTGVDVGSHGSLILDKDGHPHISYNHWMTSNLKYAWRDETGWHLETAHDDEEVGYYSSLGLDGAGQPHISYIRYAGEGIFHDLLHAHRMQSGWQIEIVERAGDRGSYASLALDAGGKPHVSYQDGRNFSLMYAYHDDEVGWFHETVIPGGQRGINTSIDIDECGFPHISYINLVPINDIEYAYRDAAGWHFEIVDTFGWMGQFSSLELDESAHPHIAYYDRDWGCLKYATRTESGWLIETVDDNGDVGQYPSLALDVSGVPHISYCDPSHDDLKYAMREDDWEIVTFVSSAQLGGYTSLALDGSGYPHISYYAGASRDLKYAYRDGRDVYVETVDSEGQVGLYSSIALDTQGNPHITYRGDGGPYKSLKYAYRGISGWEFQILTRDDPRDMSLVLDSAGRSHIAFGSASHDLKYAFQDGPDVLNLSIDMIGDAVRLSWQPVGIATGYWIFGGANLPWFIPGTSPGFEYRVAVLQQGTTFWTCTNGVGDPNANWTYLIMAMDTFDQELIRSNRVGEHDFQIDLP